MILNAESPNAPALARLICLVGNDEKAIFAGTGRRRWELTTHAKKHKTFGGKDNATEQAIEQHLEQTRWMIRDAKRELA